MTKRFPMHSTSSLPGCRRSKSICISRAASSRTPFVTWRGSTISISRSTTTQSLAAFYQFRDFAHFVDVYMASCFCLRAPEDFARIAYEVGAEAARQNTRYLEIHFNPEPNQRKRKISFRDQLDGMNEGRARALAEFGVEMRWIADGVRDAEIGPGSVTQTVEWISGLPESDGVIALERVMDLRCGGSKGRVKHQAGEGDEMQADDRLRATVRSPWPGGGSAPPRRRSAPPPSAGAAARSPSWPPAA